MKRHLLLLMVFLISLSVVYSAEEDFTFEISAIKDSIALNEQAEFRVLIHNYMDSIENLIISSPDVEWVVERIVVKVYPKSTSSKTFLVTPTKYITPGLYGVKLNIKRESTDEIVHEELLLVNVGSEKEEYVPSIKMDIDMLEKLDPREPATVVVNMENMNILNLTNLTLQISSDLPAFNREQDFSLAGLEKKTMELSFDIPSTQQPKEYKVHFNILLDNEIIESADTRIIEIISFTPEFREEVKESSWFFKTVREITYTSDSNVRNTQTVKWLTNWFAKIFTKTEPRAEAIKEDGRSFYGWSIELGPQESATVYVTTNYRPIIYIIIVAIVVLLLYLKYKSPIIVRKSVSNISIEEGGISMLKVMIDLSNRSSKELKDITVLDVVPNIADIEKASVEGTLAPSKVLRHRTKGSILKWELPELAPGEERLISYSIKSKLSIIGSFRLPRAKVKFYKDNKEYIVKSNSLRISA